MNFPLLSCPSSSKKTKQWHIQVKPSSSPTKAIIEITYGISGCKQRKLTKTFENPSCNTPSKNPKTTLQLAIASASKEHSLKLLNGYSVSRYQLRQTRQTSQAISDTISSSSSSLPSPPSMKYPPMLAHTYSKQSQHISFPCHVQPKLDGVRAVAYNNKLYSRNLNIFPDLPHIIKELSMIKDKIILDGEMYTDDINFEKIVGLVRKGHKTEEEIKDTYKIYYNVFDCIDMKNSFEKRLKMLEELFKKYKFEYIKMVKTEICKGKENVEEYLEKYVKEGYEGLILRNSKGKYEVNKRSYELQKLKKFIDEEFEIVGYTTPEDGKEVGCVIWKCRTQDGIEFTVRPEGNYEERKKMYRKGKTYIGKMLTVKFQEYTNGGVPRFPVGVSIRDYE